METRNQLIKVALSVLTEVRKGTGQSSDVRYVKGTLQQLGPVCFARCHIILDGSWMKCFAVEGDKWVFDKSFLV